jgi:S1-C subfamily serine protease
MNKMILTAAAAFALVAGETQAASAHKVNQKPHWATYTRRNGQVVPLSPSQSAIVNGQWYILAPEKIAEIAARITVTIKVDKNDGSHMLGTGFYTTQSNVITNWHVARDAKHITVTDRQGVTYDATLRNSAPSTDLAMLDVNGANNKNWAWIDGFRLGAGWRKRLRIRQPAGGGGNVQRRYALSLARQWSDHADLGSARSR